jgi:predicted acyl esterase
MSIEQTADEQARVPASGGSNGTSAGVHVAVPMRPGTPPEVTGWPGVQHDITEADGLLIERDVPVTMRDGVQLRVDLFRPVNAADAALPTLMAWAPYGKHGNVKWDSPLFGAYDLGFDTSERSSYTPFEYPDPEWWCAKGYAVVFADMRGTWGSEGDATYWSQQEALDGYDTIEWIAAQPWSTGRVGLIGCSNLAWAQWYIAASRPPHLAAINPWEGVSDFYREFAYHGGIPETNFVSVWHTLASFSSNGVEDVPAAVAAHPLMDDYWESKGPRLEDIEVPVFVAASWSDHGLHTRGFDDHVDIDVEYGSTAFHVKFDADIELTGSMAVRLYTETERADDADVYVFVRKCDTEGQPLLPLLPAGAPVLGAKGQLRASHRALDESSVVGAPVQRHDVHQPLAPGDIVELNVPVWPMGMVWHAGEQLELVVTTRDLFPTGALVTGPPQFDDAAKSENGNLRIHTGASFPSYLIANRV